MKKFFCFLAAMLFAGSMFAQAHVWDASAQGYGNAQAIDTVTYGDPVITLMFAKGTNSQNAPKYYTTGTAVRCYGGNTITVDAGENMMSVINLTFGSGDGSNEITTNGGTYADGTWTGSASTVTFTIGGSTGHRRIQTISVVFVGDSIPVDTTIVPVVIDTTEVTCSEASTIALALDHNTPTEGFYAVTGYITEILGNVSRNQQSFWMADAVDGGRVFEGYWANLPQGVDSFEVGMQIRMIGHLMKYNTTAEMKNGNVEILAMPIVPGDTDTTIVPPVMETLPLIFNANIWDTDNAKFAAWVFGDNIEAQFTDFFVPGNDSNLYLAAIPAVADSIVFVRFASEVTVPSWVDSIATRWNQTVDYAIDKEDMYFTITAWGSDANNCTGEWGTPVPPVVYNTCAEVNAITTNTDMTLGEVTVVFAKGSNIYVQDATGTTLIYTANYSDLVPGNRVSGIEGQAKLYNGLPELVPSTAFADLTVTPGEAPEIADAIASPTAANVNEVMMFRGVQMPAASFGTSRATNITGIFAGEEVAFRNNWKEAYDFDSTKTYTMLGCVAIYNGNIQVYVTNIEEEVAPEPIPTEMLVFDAAMWNIDGAKFAAWVWADSMAGEWTDFFIAVEDSLNPNLYITEIPVTAENIKFVRFAANVAAPTWEASAIWNQTGDIVIDWELMHFTMTSFDGGVWGVPEPQPVEPTVYYIKGNWNMQGWAWFAMVEDTTTNLWEYAGVYGGGGVNINTEIMDETSLYLAEEDWVLVDSAWTPQLGDTLAFIYDPTDSTLLVNLIGREPAPELVYYIKNNWDGAEDWYWAEMIPAVDQENMYVYMGVFGGQGVNIMSNYMAEEDALWFAVEDWAIQDSTFVPQVMDTIAFLFSPADTILAAELIGRPAPEPEVFQIKNNWNGAAEWTWEEMSQSELGEDIYEYTGVFGGTGVNITSNYMNGELWFPIDSFLTAEGAEVPQALDTVRFMYHKVENQLGVTIIGRPEPVIPDTVVTGVHIIDQTGWSTLNLYMWGQAGELMGTWPGTTLNEDYAVIDGEGYFFAIIGAYGNMTEHLIFNNGNGFQFPDLDMQLVDTTYEIVVRADGVYYADKVPAEAMTIAEATAVEVGEDVITRGIVTYINNKNAYIQDATAGILLYNSAAAFTNFSVGDEIIITGKRAVYGNAPELSNVALDTILSWGNTVTPIIMTLAERAADPYKNFGMMVTVKELTISAFDNYNNPTLTDGENSAVCYKMNLDTTVFHIGDVVDITAIAGYYNGIQFQGDIAGITMHVDDVYYIKNNWDGGEWTWLEMTPADDENLTWSFIGVFGGTGVNINTAAADEGALWFPVDAWNYAELGYQAQAGDTIFFEYHTLSQELVVTLIGRPEIITVQYFIKNNWNGGEWTWEIMTPADDGNITWMYQGVFGGTGVNINTAASDADAQWFPVDTWVLTTLGYEPAAGDEILFEYDSEENTLTATFMGEDGLETVTFQREGETTKVILNGQLYIIRDGKMYNALGAQVR